ncbi:MAG: hypothetical protein JO180_06920 [Gemmatirosa sp.]|nr:hypothetical protein [Gemmatirosa sp.]
MSSLARPVGPPESTELTRELVALPEEAPTPPGLQVTEAAIPTVVSAAWELELVIAGGVTFALFQLPSSIDALRTWLDPRISGSATLAMTVSYVYAKLTVYVLLGAFLLNLTARAYWVGLVGLHSVFPRGVDWDRMSFGPAAIETYRTRLVSLPAVIGRVDNFASVIFSFAFLIVVVCIFSLVGGFIAGGIAWGINALLFGGRHGLAVFETLCFGFALPLAAVGVVDKRYGARWAPESAAGRRLRRATRIAARFNGTALFGPIFFTLFTNLRKGVMMTLFYVIFIGGAVAAMVELLVRMGAVSTGTPRYVPDDDDVRGMNASFYESQRTPDASTTVPTIQSDIVDGPYVRLFIPYIAERHDPALAATCPAAAPLRPGHLHITRVGASAPAQRAQRGRLADATLACLARLHAIALDGTARPDVALRFSTHPVTGRRGMVGYIPTSALVAGPHVIRVMPPPRAPDSRTTTPLVPYEITFWK